MKSLELEGLVELNSSELTGVVGGNPLRFVYDYTIGKVLDWYIAGVIREMDNPVHGDPMDWDVVGFK